MVRRKSNSIVSLWYRAPEIILGATDYFIGVDMWSIGCILADFLQMRPLFAYKSSEEVIIKVLTLLGIPDKEVMNQWKELDLYSAIVTEDLKERVRWKNGATID